MITILLLCAVLLSFPQSYGQNESSQCPAPWMVLPPEIYIRWVSCQEKALNMVSSKCISYDATMQFAVGFCPYSYHQLEYLKQLNSSVTPSQFNEVMCGPLNREGLLCSRCKPGHGIPVFSTSTDKCVECDLKFAWPLHLALVLIPVTLFYVLLIIFDFSATHPPVTAYTFYCQLFVQMFYNVRFIKHHFDTNTNKLYLTFTMTLISIWNLDFLRSIVPSFCLNESLGPIDAHLVELIPALYLLLLILLTLILIEMHARNCRVIVILWIPLRKCFSCGTTCNTWDPRSSIVRAFVTFFLLSSFKVCFITVNSFTKILLITNIGFFKVLYNDPTILFRDIYKQAFFLPMLLLNMLFVILPLFLLAIYPTRLWRCVARRILPNRINSALFMLMDSFQGHYKNGTAGTYDYRSVSCFGFVLRLLASVSMTNSGIKGESSKNGPITGIAFLLIAVSLFYAHVRPYKKRYTNVIESILYSAAAMLLIAIIHNDHFPPLFNIILTFILLPSVAFVGFLVYKAMAALGVTSKVRKVFSRRRNGQNGAGDMEPHRLTNPTQYTPLLK